MYFEIMDKINEEIFSMLVMNSEKQIQNARHFKYHRYLFEHLKNATEGFYYGIYGIRGIGKTVMLLQLAALSKKPLYIPADAKYLIRFDLYNIVNYAISKGYNEFYIDEIHMRHDWATDLKTLYDEGSAKIIFSGSSSIELQKGADLSRRAIMYELLPASLREYLNIKKGMDLKPVRPEWLFDTVKRKNLALKYSQWSTYVEEYCKYSGMLYENIEKEYPKTIMNVIEKIISIDLASLREIDINASNNLYRMIYKVASSGPYEINYSNIANYLQVSKITAIKFINDLSKIGMIIQVFPCGSGFKKEPKIFLRIPFRNALNANAGEKTPIGAVREEFFVNNANPKCYIKTKRGEKTPDFMYNNKTIEVGGSGKENYQGADLLAVDGIDFFENKIPLFLFGFLY